jgi:hypothetical protein
MPMLEDARARQIAPVQNAFSRAGLDHLTLRRDGDPSG